MVRRRWLGWASALALALTAAACGGPSDGEKRDKRAAFVRAADKVCDTALSELRSGGSPRSYPALERRMKRNAKTLRTRVTELHRLHETLGDASSDEIDAFDGRLDVVVSATRRIGDDAELYDANGARRSSGRLRDAYDALYRAGQKAKLRVCGRGGNRAADLPLYTVYRDQYVSANIEALVRIGRRQDPRDFASYRSGLRTGMRALRGYRKRLARLAPPLAIERSHRLFVRRLRVMLRTGNTLLKLLNRGQAAAIRGGAESVLLRFFRQADLADVAEAKIRRVLKTPGGRSRPAPGQTNAA